jgi:hypothetical protein
MLNQLGVAVVGEAAGELHDETKLRCDLAQQQAAGIRGDSAAREGGDDGPGAEGFQQQLRGGTLWGTGLSSAGGVKAVS